MTFVWILCRNDVIWMSGRCRDWSLREGFFGREVGLTFLFVFFGCGFYLFNWVKRF
jgi:hypothetical protein